MKLTSLAAVLAVLVTAAPAQAWTEHVVYSPTAGSASGVISIALADLSNAFYVVFEVQDTTSATHSLYLQKWSGGVFWAAPVLLDSHVGQWIYNPSITARPGHVTVSAHQRNGACAGIVEGLREYDYDTATGLVDSSRSIDAAAACQTVGHSHIVFSPGDSLYHVCWTRKTGTGAGGTGDEVMCSSRAAGSIAWAAATNLNGVAGLANDQDHATVAVKQATNNTRRTAFHDATTAANNDAHEAQVFMDKPGGTTVGYRVPDGTASPQPGWQDRPFIALSSDDKLHVAWEDGPNGSEVVKYVRCVNSTPDGCDSDPEWEFNNVGISDPAATRARYPHLSISALRTWISYEQVIAGRNEIRVLHRCLSAPNGQAWTLTDPWSGTDDEYTEEYGTPHMDTRSIIILGLNPTVVVTAGTVSLRLNATTGYYDGVLYEMTEPACP